MVPLTFSDWRVIKKGYKDLYWQSVLQKFILDEGRRTYALQQIGRLWRAHKSRLRGKIRVYRKKKKDIARLQPEDCDDAEWEMFVKQMSKRKFILKSQKFQEMREKQDLPHTCSRQGYARLEFRMQKESPNPSSITRVDVWCKGHTKKNGKPSNSRVAERMKKIKEIRNAAASDSHNHSIQNDALSQVLGPDRYGRVRGKGAGVTPSKVGVVSQNKELVTQIQEKGAARFEFFFSSRNGEGTSHSLVVWGNKNGRGFPFAFAKEQKVSDTPDTFGVLA
ncbi:hypothetical protein IFM89_030856 [Coptis chinensis]|uniref:Uncharacterized protein n=1 Tax=Coptis chinensis TaxID=261450 RepID=A0A835LC89_9MAGN|nr:hypothetical protein IFM89_030856 [Coptis chinensis]